MILEAYLKKHTTVSKKVKVDAMQNKVSNNEEKSSLFDF